MSKIDAMDDLLGDYEEQAKVKAEEWHSKRDVYTPYPWTFFMWLMILVLPLSFATMVPMPYAVVVYLFALLPAWNVGFQVFLFLATRVYKLMGGYDD